MSGLDDFDRGEPEDRDLSDPANRLHLERNDVGNARRLQALLCDEMIYVHGRGWLVWNGTHFDAEAGAEMALGKAVVLCEAIEAEAAAYHSQPVGKALVEERMAVADLTYEQAETKIKAERKKALKDFAVRCGNVARLRAALDLARPMFKVSGDALDGRRSILQVANGTLDLDAIATEPPDAEEDDERLARLSSALRPAEKAGYPTRVAGCAFNPEARAPQWERFIGLIMPAAADRSYLQRCMGALLGGQRDEVVFVLLGQGGNGKSTLIKGIEGVMGGFAQPCRMELFCEHRSGGQGPTPEEAILGGARAYFASEPDQHVTLSAGAVKGMTGGNSRLVHAKGKEPFSLHMVGYPVMQMNRMANVNDPSDGFWRRIFPILFGENLGALPEDQRVSSSQMEAILREEREGILNWMLAGWAEYRAIGLKPPASVQALKGSLRELADPVGAFLNAHCSIGPGRRVTTTALHKAYKAWCEEEGNKTMSGKAFTAAMLARDHTRGKSHGKRYWHNIELLHEPPTSTGAE
ncbi:MAG: phage/plasmid primase, P4 family [Pseudomonadota bacterium]